MIWYCAILSHPHHRTIHQPCFQHNDENWFCRSRIELTRTWWRRMTTSGNTCSRSRLTARRYSGKRRSRLWTSYEWNHCAGSAGEGGQDPGGLKAGPGGAEQGPRHEGCRLWDWPDMSGTLNHLNYLRQIGKMFIIQSRPIQVTHNNSSEVALHSGIERVDQVVNCHLDGESNCQFGDSKLTFLRWKLSAIIYFKAASVLAVVKLSFKDYLQLSKIIKQLISDYHFQGSECASELAGVHPGQPQVSQNSVVRHLLHQLH